MTAPFYSREFAVMMSFTPEVYMDRPFCEACLHRALGQHLEREGLTAVSVPQTVFSPRLSVHIASGYGRISVHVVRERKGYELVVVPWGNYR